MNSKKIIAAILGVLVAAFSFTACGDKTEDEKDKKDKKESVSVSEKATEADDDEKSELEGIELGKTTVREMNDMNWDVCTMESDLDQTFEFKKYTQLTGNLNNDTLYYVTIELGEDDTYGSCIVTNIEKMEDTFDINGFVLTKDTIVYDLSFEDFELDCDGEWLSEEYDGEGTGVFCSVEARKDGMVYDIEVYLEDGENGLEANFDHVDDFYKEADYIG